MVPIILNGQVDAEAFIHYLKVCIAVTFAMHGAYMCTILASKQALKGSPYATILASKQALNRSPPTYVMSLHCQLYTLLIAPMA